MSSRNNRRGIRRTRKEQLENVGDKNETPENVNSLNDVEMEFRDVVDKSMEVEHVNDIIGHRRKKNRLKRKAPCQKTEDINPVRLNCEHSCSDKTPNLMNKGTLPKMNSDLSNGKTDFSRDACSMEEETSFKCCAGKQKRFECDNYNSKGSGLICVGILPGFKTIISSSDDSDQSCSSDLEQNENKKYDLLGRKIVYVAKKSTESK